MRGVILAFQFLTRFPLPALTEVTPQERTDSSLWFPLVGLTIGAVLVFIAWLFGQSHHWLVALVVLLAWVAITGALHLDGAADLADALGAVHGSSENESERFFSVLKDPHIGSFGVVVLIAILLTKFVALACLMEFGTSCWPLLLIPAWARFGAVYWGQTLNPLALGLGASLSKPAIEPSSWCWGLGLFILSAISVSLLFALLAVLFVYAWGAFLQWRVGGMTGDCLGAGIEYVECAMLIIAVMGV